MAKTTVTVTAEGDNAKTALAVLKNIADYLGGCGVAIRLEDPEALNKPYRDIGSLKDDVFIVLREKKPEPTP
jgi:hypothetical protein